MDPRELRIGNFVLNSAGVQIEIQRHDFTIYDGLENIEDYSPIPLTPEWIEKFGFERLFQKWVLDGYIYFCEGLVWLECDCNGAKFTNDIIYVHQLQNLYFALTGTELQLKN